MCAVIQNVIQNVLLLIKAFWPNPLKNKTLKYSRRTMNVINLAIIKALMQAEQARKISWPVRVTGVHSDFCHLVMTKNGIQVEPAVLSEVEKMSRLVFTVLFQDLHKEQVQDSIVHGHIQ